MVLLDRAGTFLGLNGADPEGGAFYSFFVV